ncbi:MAG: MBL fold metallo-hydrolase [Archaeoglobus sp.]|jgi:7,8-dihydropterin-6-yl-methyl-4-(beta-D-ribofuranosyl)aminobenzene 5'-phosphate synthase|nr:MAG: MBL fold metallo-hydrolase [Archaeoglobus sp.]
MFVKILADNCVSQLRPKKLLAEWGFSALVGDVLFDTGQNVAAIQNSRTMGVDDFSCIVLSHGHYDHTGALQSFLEIYGRKKVYMHPDAWLPRVYRETPIGIPWQKSEIECLGDIVEHVEPVEVSKGITALGEIPRNEKDLGIGKILKNGVWQDDKIMDDQSLVVKTKDGLLLVLGCCHAGLKNTVDYAEEVCCDEVKFILGGTHLVGLKDDEVREVASWLKKKIEMLAPCHCTGFKAEAILFNELRNKFAFAGVGSVFEFR